MTVTINKWGHSLVLRLPKKLAEKNELLEGTEVELIESPDGLLIRKKKMKITLDQLVKSYPKNYDPAEELIPDLLSSEEW